MGRVYRTFATACASALTVFALSHARAQKTGGVAETPPMGWNHYGCDSDEDLIEQTADAIARNGLKDAGYAAVDLLDCRRGERGAETRVSYDQAAHPVGGEAAGPDAGVGTVRYEVTDLFASERVGTTAKALTGTVPARDALMFRMKKGA